MAQHSPSRLMERSGSLIATAALLGMAFGGAVRGQPQQATLATTQAGVVKGAAENGLTVYRGIPYAAPPLGNLRWRPPQPVTKWDGVRQTTTFAHDPFQGDGRGNVGEDCLYLNVWTPLPKLGFGLWRFPAASATAELTILVIGAYFYWRAALATSVGNKRSRATASFSAVLILTFGLIVLTLDVTGVAG